MTIASNLSAIHERIARAARRAGRNPGAIVLMAVTKTFPSETIIEAYEAGQRLFGENRVQEFAEKVGGLSSLRDAACAQIRRTRRRFTSWSDAAEWYARDAAPECRRAQSG